jgi:indoleamine 2,3-dioxygenase
MICARYAHTPHNSNLAMLHTFTGGMDEVWFYLVPLAIEALGGPCVGAMVRIQQAIWAAEHPATSALINPSPATTHATICLELEGIRARIHEMTVTLKAMYARNDPHIFWQRTRPYSAGSKNNAALPHGLYYEGVPVREEDAYCLQEQSSPCPPGTLPGSWRAYAGASAGQSPLIHALDVGLSVHHHPMTSGPASPKGMRTRHPSKAPSPVAGGGGAGGGGGGGGGGSSPPPIPPPPLPPPPQPSNPMHEMREYLDASQRAFLAALAAGPDIRAHCSRHPDADDGGNGLADAFNACIHAFKGFRDAHMQLVTVYILLQAKRHAQPPMAPVGMQEEGRERGTGGTALIPFLRQVRQETVDAALPTAAAAADAAAAIDVEDMVGVVEEADGRE